MKFNLVKTKKGYLPATDEDLEKSRKVGIGEVIRCSSLDIRSVEHHRKFFALITLAWENLPEKYDGYFPTPDDLRYELIKRAGFYREYTDLKGNKQYIPESIAFDKMGQERFEKLYSAVLDQVCRMLGLDAPELMDALTEFM